MIYKTFYGSHIDISKIISISDVYFEDNMGRGGYFVGFSMSFQLMDKPLLYRRKLTIDEYGGYCSGYVRNVALIDGRVVEYEYGIEDKEIQAVANLQKQIDEIIKVWKDFKKTSQSSIEARLSLIEDKIQTKGD